MEVGTYLDTLVLNMINVERACQLYHLRGYVVNISQ